MEVFKCLHPIPRELGYISLASYPGILSQSLKAVKQNLGLAFDHLYRLPGLQLQLNKCWGICRS